MQERLSLGFDLGGTQTRAALVSGREVVSRAAVATDVAGGPEAVIAQFIRLASDVSAGVDRSLIKAVGIATPGPLDTVSGVVDHIPTLPGWDQFPLRARFADAFSLPVIVENDGIAATYGEWKFGAGRGLNNMVFVTVSTGIGGGAVVDGRILRGRRGMATHIGHFRMAPDGPVCSCGRAGCFEGFAAGTALGRRARAAATANPSGYLGRIATGETVESRHAVDGARLGDADCLALIEEEAELLGTGFTDLIHLFSPERVVMGGGVSKAFDMLDDGIHAAIRRQAMAPFKDIPVVPAELGDNAGLLGVAALALSNAGEG
jgi:glucokinase